MYLTLLTDLNDSNNYGKIKSLNDVSIKVEVNGNEYNLHTSTKHLLMKVNSFDTLSEDVYISELEDKLENLEI